MATGGIGGLAIQLPGAARGEDRAGRPDDLQAALAVQADDADAPVLLVGQQVDGEEILDDLDVRALL